MDQDSLLRTEHTYGFKGLVWLYLYHKLAAEVVCQVGGGALKQTPATKGESYISHLGTEASPEWREECFISDL